MKDKVGNILGIFFILFLIHSLVSDIHSDCYSIGEFSKENAKDFFIEINSHEKVFNELKRKQENFSKETIFKTWGVEKEINEKLQTISINLKKLKKMKIYLENPSKFQEEKCSKFCIPEEKNGCEYKYRKFLIEVGSYLKEIRKNEKEAKDIFNIYEFSLKNKEKLKILFFRLVIDIDQKIDFMRKLISDYAKKYPFNRDEIEKRGKFYIERLEKEKNLIKKYLNSGNYYQLAKYCIDNAENKMLDCIKNKNIDINGNYTNTPNIERECKLIEKLDFNSKCYLKIATIFSEFTNVFKELDKDFFVILLNKKIEYKAKFGFYTWDDYVDYPIEHYTTAEVKISEGLYNLLQNFLNSNGWEIPICIYKGGLSCRVLDTELSSLIYTILNKVLIENNDNAAEVYLEDLYKVYYHLYLYKGDLYNIKPNPKWVEVDEKTYKLFDQTNRIVMVKPKGYFTDQMFLEPKEIYNSLVGNKMYGYYQNGVWHWLPMYLFISQFLDRIYYSQNKQVPPYIKDEILGKYLERKKVLKDYAKKYGLCADPQCKKRENLTTSSYGSYRGGLRTLGERYRGRGYGGLGK